MQYEEIERKVRKVICTQLEIDQNEQIKEDEELLQKYELNSIDALELLLLLEKEFDVEIDDDDLNARLLTSIRSIAEYFKKLISQ